MKMEYENESFLQILGKSCHSGTMAGLFYFQSRVVNLNPVVVAKLLSRR